MFRRAGAWRQPRHAVDEVEAPKADHQLLQVDAQPQADQYLRDEVANQGQLAELGLQVRGEILVEDLRLLERRIINAA